MDNRADDLVRLAYEIAELRAQVSIMWRVFTAVTLMMVGDIVLRVISLTRRNGGQHNGNGKMPST